MIIDNEKLFAFVLGRETELSLLELKAVFSRFGFGFCESKNHSNTEDSTSAGRTVYPERAELTLASRRDVPSYTILSVTDNIAIIKVANSSHLISHISELIGVLGGTVKIFELTNIDSSDLAKEISGLILDAKKDIATKVDFGISDYRSSATRTDGSSRPMSSNDINRLGLDVKTLLKPDLKSRFIFVKEGRELSSIVSEANKLDRKGIEVGIFRCHPRPDRGSTIVDSRLHGNDEPFDSAQGRQFNSGLFIGQLVALSDPFAWSRRDYGKPEGDKYSGMLPPKLARMMINLALSPEMTKSECLISNKMSNESNQNNSKICNLSFDICNYNNSVVVCDPFCGSGNIPIEAMMLGCDVVASDVSEKAVHDTMSNISWTKSQIINRKSQTKNECHSEQSEESRDPSAKPQDDNNNLTIEQSNNETIIFQSDATKDDFLNPLKAKSSQLIAIVTEPYLGEPKKFKPSKAATLGEFNKLRNEYIGFLTNLADLLKAKSYKLSAVCLIFPLVESSDNGRISLWSESVDEIKNLGYTLLRPPLVYGRDYQVVKREIVLLQLHN